MKLTYDELNEIIKPFIRKHFASAWMQEQHRSLIASFILQNHESLGIEIIEQATQYPVEEKND